MLCRPDGGSKPVASLIEIPYGEYLEFLIFVYRNKARNLFLSKCFVKCKDGSFDIQILIEIKTEDIKMHEYHKAVEWVDKANAEAAAKSAKKVTAINVTFGESSGYSPEVVKNYFDEAAKGTACEGADFNVTVGRSNLVCPVCGEVYEKKLLDYSCPSCGAEGNPTESGNEVLLNSIECE